MNEREVREKTAGFMCLGENVRRLFISLLGDHTYLYFVCGEDYSVGSRRVRNVIYFILVREYAGSCLLAF